MAHFKGHVEPQTYQGIQKKKNAEVLENEFAANQVKRGELDAMMLRAAADSLAGNQSRQSFDRSSQVRGPLPNMADLIPPAAQSSGGRGTTAGLEALANARRVQPSINTGPQGPPNVTTATNAAPQGAPNAGPNNLTAIDAIKSILNPVNDQGVSPYFPNSTINPANDPGVSSYFPNKNIYSNIDNYGMDPYFPNKDLTDEQLKAAYGENPFGSSTDSPTSTPENGDEPNVTQCPPGSAMNADGQCELIEPPEEAGCPEGYSKNAAGVCVIDPVVVVEPPPVAVDLFGNQATLINQQLGGLSTKNFTDDIKALMAEAEKGAKAVTAQQIKDIAASFGVAEGNIDAVAKAATTALNAQESKRKAVQAEVGTIAANQITAMLDRQEADVAAGQALLGENLTSEFAEVVQLTNALINSQAVSAQSSMGRIQAIGNMAAAQRLAAPALLMADAKNALGDERFRLEGQAQASLVKTLNSLSIQEKELVLAEAQRIESFNNNRDAALAQALVNNGMAKLQNTIEEQRLAVASAARASEVAAARQASLDAAEESARRFQLEFGLKKSEAASVQAARIAQTNSETSKAQQKYQTSQALAFAAFGPNVTEQQIGYINALSPAMQSDLYTKSINQIDAFNSQSSGATFEALRADGFSPDVSNNALKYVSLKNQIELAEKLTENLPSNPTLYSQAQKKAVINLATAAEGGNTKTSFVMQQAEIESKYPEEKDMNIGPNGSFQFFSQPDNDPRNSFFAAVDRVIAGQSFTMERSEIGAPPGYPGAGGKGFTDYQPFTTPIIDPNSIERKYFMSGRLS